MVRRSRWRTRILKVIEDSAFSPQFAVQGKRHFSIEFPRELCRQTKGIFRVHGLLEGYAELLAKSGEESAEEPKFYQCPPEQDQARLVSGA